jgi:lipopolysaccharide export system protein LptA
MSELFFREKRDNSPSPPFNSPLSKGGYRRVKGRLGAIFLLIALLLISFSITSQGSATGNKDEPKKEEGKEAKLVVITSDRLMADNIKHTALFEGNVIAKTEDMTIYSDRMMVYYTEDGKKMDRIEASGNVKVVRGERTVVSNEATYYDEEEKVVFTGNPQAWEGDNKVTGTVMTYFIKDDRSIVENSKVVIINKKGKESKK